MTHEHTHVHTYTHTHVRTYIRTHSCKVEERRETALNAALIVKKIVIRKGDLIGGFIFEGVQGGVEKTIMKHGGDGGAELEPWIMKENEYITMISGTGDGGDTMSSLTFDTNLRKGTYGTPNRQTFEFKAEEGHMIVGVKGPSGFCPKITDIVTEPCPWEHSVCEAIPITGPFLDALTILRTLSTDFQPHEHDTLLQSGLFECIEKLIERAKSTKYGKDELSAASWQFLELLVSRLVGAANEGQLSPAATHLLTSLTHQLSSAASALSSFDAARAAVPHARKYGKAPVLFSGIDAKGCNMNGHDVLVGEVGTWIDRWGET